MLYLCVSYAEIAQPVQAPVGSSFAVAVAADAECVVSVGTDVKASVGGQTDVMELAEAGNEQATVEKQVGLAMGAEVVPGQTAVRWPVRVAVAVVAAVAAVADEPASAETAWSAEADGFVGTAADITVLGSEVLTSQCLRRPPAASGEAEKTAIPGV